MWTWRGDAEVQRCRGQVERRKWTGLRGYTTSFYLTPPEGRSKLVIYPSAPQNTTRCSLRLVLHFLDWCSAGGENTPHYTHVSVTFNFAPVSCENRPSYLDVLDTAANQKRTRTIKIKAKAVTWIYTVIYFYKNLLLLHLSFFISNMFGWCMLSLARSQCFILLIFLFFFLLLLHKIQTRTSRSFITARHAVHCYLLPCYYNEIILTGSSYFISTVQLSAILFSSSKNVR